MLVRTDAPSRLKLHINGSRFSDLHAGPQMDALQDFPFSPTGEARFNIDLVPGSADQDLITRQFSIALGTPGIELPMRAMPASNVLRDAAHLLPLAAQPMQREVAIIIPVYNAPGAVRRCLDSVLEHSNGLFRMIVIDDASTDPEIAPLLASYRERMQVVVHANPVNLGFTATVNRGMQLADRADVLLLNADTEVSANWLNGLRHALHSAPDVATATAVSDNAGAFSVPDLERENALPPAWTLAQTARSAWQDAGAVYPELPTGNGFCMLIRREVLDAVGLFDVAAFPQGYGEENDFCQRASAKGWRHVIAGNVYVAHARSLSFGSERRQALGVAGMQVLRERWPNYESDVGRTLFSFERRVLDWRIRQSQATSGIRAPLPRRVNLLHVQGHDPRHEDWTLFQKDEQITLISGNGEIRESVENSRFDDLRCAHWLQLHAVEFIVLPDAMESHLATMLARQAQRLGISVSSEGNKS